jgi:hypothetical protein
MVALSMGMEKKAGILVNEDVLSVLNRLLILQNVRNNGI